MASGDPDATEGPGTRRRHTLADADIDVVEIEIRIGQRSKVAASSTPLTTYEPSDYNDISNYRPSPPNHDINDLRNDHGDSNDPDAWNHP